MKTFYAMTQKELRAYINGCHASREYDSYFDYACKRLHTLEALGIRGYEHFFWNHDLIQYGISTKQQFDALRANDIRK
jgi:hypothetical protein